MNLGLEEYRELEERKVPRDPVDCWARPDCPEFRGCPDLPVPKESLEIVEEWAHQGHQVPWEHQAHPAHQERQVLPEFLAPRVLWDTRETREIVEQPEYLELTENREVQEGPAPREMTVARDNKEIQARGEREDPRETRA